MSSAPRPWCSSLPSWRTLHHWSPVDTGQCSSRLPTRSPTNRRYRPAAEHSATVAMARVVASACVLTTSTGQCSRWAWSAQNSKSWARQSWSSSCKSGAPGSPALSVSCWGRPLTSGLGPRFAHLVAVVCVDGHQGTASGESIGHDRRRRQPTAASGARHGGGPVQWMLQKLWDG
jgi:hypothetical protein